MQKVYLVVRESYEYWDNEHTVSYEVLADKKSAENFLAMVKSSLFTDIAHGLKDWLKEEERDSIKTFDDIEKACDSDGLDFYYADRSDYFAIDIEEWGSETIAVIEKDIMSFQ